MKRTSSHHIILLIISLVFLWLGHLPLASQVTIGSTLKPNIGSLLDLKEHEPDSENATAKRGLMLPRVTLKKLTGELSETLGVTESYSNLEHTGLIVYNVADPECPAYLSGAYTWDGSSWVYLGSDDVRSKHSYEEDPQTGDGMLTDYEGNSYTTHRFRILLTDGTEYNKVWMTQNLRSLRDANGEWIDCPEGMYFNQGTASTTKVGVNVVTEIPEGVIDTYSNAGQVVTGQSYNDFVSTFGLLYNMQQALKACPDKWHLPTYDEWNEFLTVLGGKDNVGHEMKSNIGTEYKSIENASYTWGINGTVPLVGVNPNGFNAVPAGYVDGGTKGARYFGRYTSFYGVKSLVSINHNLAKADLVTRAETSTMYNSVRCVKD